jgi:hypothetical protein
VQTPVFIPEDSLRGGGYGLVATPRVFPGQSVFARVIVPSHTPQAIEAALAIRAYGDADAFQEASCEPVLIHPGQEQTLRWDLPEMGNWPILDLGIRARGKPGASFIIDRIGWDGVPAHRFDPPSPRTGRLAVAWERSWGGWMHGFHYHRGFGAGGAFNLVHNEGRGLLHTGSPDWRDYRVQTQVIPWLNVEFGLAIRVRGLLRYYALIARAGQLQLVRMNHEQAVLASVAWEYEQGKKYGLFLEARGTTIRGGVLDGPALQATDDAIDAGGLGMIVNEGRAVFDALTTEVNFRGIET